MLRVLGALLLLACAGCSAGGASPMPIMTYWRATETAAGFKLTAPHMGVDFFAQIGHPVLAAADGEVTVLDEGGALCGTKVVIHHVPHDAYTIYCHLASYSVGRGPVRRGSTIGYVGTTGAVRGPVHLHLELFLGGRNVDPLEHVKGCFSPAVTYPTDRLVLTAPLRC